MLLEFDIDTLVKAHVHEMDRCSALPDHLEVGLVLGVVEAMQFSVVDTESVVP
jgi:hypothetical protein